MPKTKRERAQPTPGLSQAIQDAEREQPFGVPCVKAVSAGTWIATDAELAEIHRLCVCAIANRPQTEALPPSLHATAALLETARDEIARRHVARAP